MRALLLALLVLAPLAAATPPMRPVRIELDVPRLLPHADAPFDALLRTCAPGYHVDLALGPSVAPPAWTRTFSPHDGCATIPLRVQPEGDGVRVHGNATREGEPPEVLHAYHLYPLTYATALARSGPILLGAAMVVLGSGMVLFTRRR